MENIKKDILDIHKSIFVEDPTRIIHVSSKKQKEEIKIFQTETKFEYIPFPLFFSL